MTYILGTGDEGLRFAGPVDTSDQQMVGLRAINVTGAAGSKVADTRVALVDASGNALVLETTGADGQSNDSVRVPVSSRLYLRDPGGTWSQARSIGVGANLGNVPVQAIAPVLTDGAGWIRPLNAASISDGSNGSGHGAAQPMLWGGSGNTVYRARDVGAFAADPGDVHGVQAVHTTIIGTTGHQRVLSAKSVADNTATGENFPPAGQMLYEPATDEWFKERGTVEAVAHALAARTATPTAVAVTNYDHRSLLVVLHVTVAGTGTLKIRLAARVATREFYLDDASIAVTATGTYAVQVGLGVAGAGMAAGYLKHINAVLPRILLLTVDHSDGSAWTYEMSYVLGR